MKWGDNDKIYLNLTKLYLKNNCKIFLIIGADNLVKFHKWYKWKSISQKCNILVFDRLGYKSKSLKSIAFKQLKQKNLKFVNFKKHYMFVKWYIIP